MAEEYKRDGGRKIGARVLSGQEVALILPTYAKLKEQIEEIREEVTGKREYEEEAGAYDFIQKTNNIGIMGARGTGKTSVLKTIVKELEKENFQKGDQGDKIIKNIILPMIVPENMSESMNLMAAILGLFKKEVDVIEKEAEQSGLACWQDKQPGVIKCYKELVKRYCYIQNEYRQVIIGQYTTENDYVKRSSEIFNSDIEFIKRFREFIKDLTGYKRRYDEKAMIFIFIDDIDLSTRRCTDVVKTLLSYLSHPRIITFVSGDLDTFEEALTLDFARQDQMMESDLLKEKFINNQTVKQRKRILAYEYLKKVIPPVYRHTVKHWALEARGDYRISMESARDADERNETSKDRLQGDIGKRLADLLTESFGTYNCAEFFQYYDHSGAGDTDVKDGNKKIIPEIFHLFDDTSRGLNNVYNALMDTNRILKMDDKEHSHFIAVKLFLETVVAAKPIYNTFRNFLLEDVIQFGESFETTSIRCNNFFSSVFEKRDKADGDKRDDDSDASLDTISPEVRFQLYIFLEFSLRVLKKEGEFKEKEYRECKREALLCLFNYPVISGSTQRIHDNERISLDKNRYQCGGNGLDINGQAILGLVFENDFLYALRVYQYIKKYDHTFSNILMKIMEDENNNKAPASSRSEYCRILTFLYWGLVAEGKLSPGTAAGKIVGNLQILREQYGIISRYMSPDSRMNVLGGIVDADVIMRGIPARVVIKSAKFAKDSYTSLNSQFWWKIDRVYLPWMTNFAMNLLNDVWGDELFEGNRLRKIVDMENKYPMDTEEDEKRFQYIQSLESQNLWNMSLVETVKAYIQKQLQNSFKQVEESTNLAVNTEKTSFMAAYKRFMGCPDGVSNTKAAQTKIALEKYGLDTVEERHWLSIDEYIEIEKIIQNLAWNSNVWYGRSEAWDLLRNLRMLPITLFKSSGSNWKAVDKEAFKEHWPILPWLHAYISYRLAEQGADSVYKQGSILADFSEAITRAQQLSMNLAKEEFEHMVGQGGVNGLGFSEIEALFGEDKED